MATFSNDINAFSFGVSYRSVQNRFDNQQLQIAPVVKVRFNKFMIGATYNLECLIFRLMEETAS
jgi:hypothetical protein